MSDSLGGAAVDGFLQREQRQLACAVEIAITMLVMDRERFGRKPAKRAHADHSTYASGLGDLEHLTPDRGGVAETPFTPVPQRQSIQRFGPDVGSARFRAAPITRGGLIQHICAAVQPIVTGSAFVDTAQRERLGAVAAREMAA